MVSLFDMSHLKGRYQAMIKDRSVKLHATISELIGTGIVVFIGTYSSGIVTEAQASLSTGHPANMELHYQFFISALVFGLMYFAIMCATRVHGAAHLNPVITIASMLAGLTGLVQGLLHITAQVLGAIIGSAIVRGLTPSGARDDALFGANILFDTDDVNKSRAFGAEIMGTFILTYIYLQVFSHPKSEHRKIAPLAVGLSYVALLTAVGPVSSASLNPARSLGPATVSGEGDELWIWTIGPLIGAVIAVPFHLLSVTDLPEMDKDGNMIKKSSSAVDIAQADPKRVAVPQPAAEQRVGGMV